MQVRARRIGDVPRRYLNQAIELGELVIDSRCRRAHCIWPEQFSIAMDPSANGCPLLTRTDSPDSIAVERSEHADVHVVDPLRATLGVLTTLERFAHRPHAATYSVAALDQRDIAPWRPQSLSGAQTG